jgi:hypothetical protein
MKTEQIVMCVVALALGMLVANMLTNVCGCKTGVEGMEFNGEPVPQFDDAERTELGLSTSAANALSSPATSCYVSDTETEKNLCVILNPKTGWSDTDINNRCGRPGALRRGINVLKDYKGLLFDPEDGPCSPPAPAPGPAQAEAAPTPETTGTPTGTPTPAPTGTPIPTPAPCPQNVTSDCTSLQLINYKSFDNPDTACKQYYQTNGNQSNICVGAGGGTIVWPPGRAPYAECTVSDSLVCDPEDPDT